MSILRLLLVAASAAACAFAAQARPLADIQKQGKIVIATEGQYPPFNYFKGNKLSGFEVELAEALAAKMGVAVEWKALNFDALLLGLRQDRWDLVIASHGITDERSKAATFAQAHYCSGGVIVTLDPAVHTIKDLAGRVVAVQSGSTYFDKVRQLAQAVREVKNFPQDNDARGALASGRADVWVTDQFIAMQARSADPSAGFQLGDYLFIERIAAAVGKGNPSLADAWNKALAEALADGSYRGISKKYFGTDIRCAF